MRKEPKKAQLDVCDHDKDAVQMDSKRNPSKTISRGSNLSVQQNGYEISLTVLIVKKDRFIGKIMAFDATPDRYKDLAIGDIIEFKKENICSIP